MQGLRLMLVVLALAMPSAALAQSPPDDQYGQPPGTQPTPSPTPSGSGGEQSRPDDDSDDDDGGNGGANGDRDDGDGGGRDAGTDREVGANGLPLRDARGGSLPFTGLDLSLIVLAGLALTAGGFAIRAVQRTQQRRAG